MIQESLARFFAIVGLVATALMASFAGVYIHRLQLGNVPSLLGSPQTCSASAAIDAAEPPLGAWTDGPADVANPQAPVTVVRQTADGVHFITVEGGVAGSRRSDRRLGVGDFVKEYNAAAGLNGTFFANASLAGTDNGLIGPSLCGDEPAVTIGPYDQRSQLAGRPLVLIAPNRIRIIPYDPDRMDDESSLRGELDQVTDLFLGGVWLVHNGAAADSDRLATYHVKDCNDTRRRAFFCIMDDGRPALGATTCATSSRQLAKALAISGIREAVLLDSGFSTSLVCGDRILVTGHTAPGIPSRPVPHSILLFGNFETATAPTTAVPPAG